MIQKPKSTQLYQSELLGALIQTGIRQTSPGGKARAFTDIIGDKMGDLDTRTYSNLAQTLLPYATGNNLDFLGEIYGVPRIQRSDVSSSSSENNFRFYVLRGNFGNINNGQSVVVPQGTRIFTASDAGPFYITAAPLTLSAAESSTSFSANSVNPGEGGNAPAGVFTRHNFTNYADSRFGTLLVTNNFGLIGGRDTEGDDSYRYRINLKLQSRGGSAETDIRLAILNVPGVQDVVFKRDAGTFTAYVFGISPVVPPSLLMLVQAQIDEHTAYPLVGTAVTPDLVGISLATTVSFTSNASPSDKQTAISAAAAAAQNYINNLTVDQELVINEISDRIRNADSRILDIGEPNKPLQEVFVWRSRLDGTRFSRFLVANYSPIQGERILVESIPNAINLTAA